MVGLGPVWFWSLPVSPRQAALASCAQDCLCDVIHTGTFSSYNSGAEKNPLGHTVRCLLSICSSVDLIPVFRTHFLNAHHPTDIGNSFLKTSSILFWVIAYRQCYSFKWTANRTQPHIHMCPFAPKLPSHPGCHITLNRVPCILQEVLAG